MLEDAPYIVRAPVALLTGITSLWIILAGMSTQAVFGMTANLLPETMAWALGIFMTTPICFLAIPAFLSAIVGVAGLPFSLPLLIYSTILSLWPKQQKKYSFPRDLVPFLQDAFTFVIDAVGTLWKYFIFPLPSASNESSPWISWLLLREPCKYYPPLESQTKKGDNHFPEEKWIYINGVATTKAIADANRIILFRMFGRPIHLLHNPSDTILLDLFECLAGKTGLFNWGEIEPREMLKEELRKSLHEAKQNGIKKIVLVAHSQGTIITSNALTDLGKEDDTKALMQELVEVYNFANCAHQTPADYVKHLENISNGGDVVAWLGHLFPKALQPYWKDKSGKSLSISGEGVIEPRLWGHLLNSHYLFQMSFGKYPESLLVKDYMQTNQKGQVVNKLFTVDRH